MRRAVSMPSALIKLPLRDPVIPSATPQFKHAPQGWATNSSRLWQPSPTPCWPDGCLESAPGEVQRPSGEQPRGKIGQLPRVGSKAKVGPGKTCPKQPIVKLRRPLQAEEVADIEGVMEGSGLIVQHNVIRPRHPHNKTDAGGGEQGQQIVHVVLIGLGVVGVANVDAERQAEQLAAEVVLESGTDDFLAVIKILRTDEADHAVDQQG